ncbi:MAG: FecR family protein [Acidobacteria bacterium]|nr:FecR family protein [Acidobacteriota bacterium]
MKFEWFQGEVHLSVPGHQQLIRVQRDTLVKVNQLNGVMVITNEGWAEYSVEDRLNVIQEAGSSLTMVSGEPEGRGLVLSLALDRGTSTFTVNPGRNNAIVVRASGVEVRATKKARFRIDADPDSARVTVFDGKVQVKSAEETLEVAKGYSLTFSAGTLTRLAQRKPSARTYGVSARRYPSGGYTGVSFSYGFGFNNYWDCGWGSYGYYGGGFYSYSYGGIYGYPYGGTYGSPYGGWGDCGWPVYWLPAHRPVTTPPPTVVPVPTPRPPVVPRPIPPRRGDTGGRGKNDLPPVRDLVLPRPAGTMTTMRVAPITPSPRSAAAAEVLRPVVARAVSREDVSFPHRNVPLTDRVDVQPIPRERAGRPDMMPRAGNASSYRDPSSSYPGSSGSDRRGNNPNSGGGASGGSAPSRPPSGGYSSGSSSGGGAPAPHAAPPPAPAAPPSHPTQPPSRPGKPIE